MSYTRARALITSCGLAGGPLCGCVPDQPTQAAELPMLPSPPLMVAVCTGTRDEAAPSIDPAASRALTARAGLIREAMAPTAAAEVQRLRAHQAAESARVAYRAIQAERPQRHTSLLQLRLITVAAAVALDGVTCYLAAEVLAGNQVSTLEWTVLLFLAALLGGEAVLINGYTSARGGSATYNMALSAARALAVRARLVALGLPPRQIAGAEAIRRGGQHEITSRKGTAYGCHCRLGRARQRQQDRKAALWWPIGAGYGQSDSALCARLGTRNTANRRLEDRRHQPGHSGLRLPGACQLRRRIGSCPGDGGGLGAGTAEVLLTPAIGQAGVLTPRPAGRRAGLAPAQLRLASASPACRYLAPVVV